MGGREKEYGDGDEEARSTGCTGTTLGETIERAREVGMRLCLQVLCKWIGGRKS